MLRRRQRLTRRTSRGALLAAGLLLLAMMHVPPAHAGWRTGNGNPPALHEQTCPDGMLGTVAWFAPDHAPLAPLPSPLEIAVHLGTPTGSGKPPGHVLAQGLYDLPAQPLVVDAEDLGWLLWREGLEGVFDHSVTFKFAFEPDANVAVGDWVTVTARVPGSDNYRLFQSYKVPNCTLIDVIPGEFPNEIDVTKPDATIDVEIPSPPPFHARAVLAASARLTALPASPRQGKGAGAKPIATSWRDSHGDGLKEFVLTFALADVGVTCATTHLRLTADMPRRPFPPGVDPVEPEPCPGGPGAKSLP